ncbi:MAG: acyl-CoA thioesterase [Gemmatimonadetes bacterium]|nr:acyl-CoA thioesterase [Gemmatimonadota bacterium]
MSELDSKPVRESHATMSELMMPHMANNHGTVFGGVILSLVDRVAGVAAVRHSRSPCVTASFDQVDFNEPIYLGELVVANASVNFVGKTSMEVGVRIDAEDLITGKKRHTNSCYVTFVSVDDEGKPRVAPPIVPESEAEVRRYEAAKQRRQRRLGERRLRVEG